MWVPRAPRPALCATWVGTWATLINYLANQEACPLAPPFHHSTLPFAPPSPSHVRSNEACVVLVSRCVTARRVGSQLTSLGWLIDSCSSLPIVASNTTQVHGTTYVTSQHNTTQHKTHKHKTTHHTLRLTQFIMRMTHPHTVHQGLSSSARTPISTNLFQHRAKNRC